MQNKIIQDAVSRRIEIIGEAVKNLPVEFTNTHKSIEWNLIAGMRDKLIHHYFGIDIEKIWGVIIKDLPELKKKLISIIEKEK